MKYKVFFDSNQIYNENGPLGQPFNMAIPDLDKLLKKHKKRDKVSISVSDIVVRERVQGKLVKVEENVEAANKVIESLNEFGYGLEKIKPLSLKDHQEILEKNAATFLSDYKVEQISCCNLDINNLIDRAIIKLKPFGEKGAGFKDTLIFLSMIQDALTIAEEATFVFCTKDRHFNQDVIEEFQKVTGKILLIVSTPEEVKEKLDELLPLGLHLESRNEEIKEFILKKTGTLIKKINSPTFIQQRRRPETSVGWGGALSVSDFSNSYNAYSYRGFPSYKEGNIAGYDYEDIDFINFEDLGDSNIKVEVRLNTSVVYKEDQDSNDMDDSAGLTLTKNPWVVSSNASGRLNSWPRGGGGGGFGSYFKGFKTETFNMTIICNPATGQFRVDSVF